MAELLFWPALLAYGEAAVAYAGDARHPGSMGRLATWGVRIGWLVQTALLVAQAARADGFPWDTWAGSLNLFVWLVVGAYLIWGCKPRYRLLGLVVMPLAALLLAISYAAGGVDGSGQSGYSTLFLVAARRARARRVRGPHARRGARRALPLAGAGAEAAQLARCCASARPRSSRSSRSSARTVAFSLPVLTLGMAVGFARLRHGSQLDPLIVLTVLTWAVYGAFLVLRFGSGLARPARRVHDAGRLRARRRAPAQPAHGAFRMSLVLVGTSHRLSPVEVRERVALDLDGAAELARQTGRRRRGGLPLDLQPHGALPRGRGSGAAEKRASERACSATRSSSTGCPTRLRRCTCSASRPGSTRSCRARARSSARCATHTRRARAGRCSTGCSAQALHVGKKVRTETAIDESPASVSSAAAALAQQVFGDLTGCRVLLVGAGEVSELAAGALAARGASIGAVTSRTQRTRRGAGRGVRRARGSVRPARDGARPRGRRRLLDELVRSRLVQRTRCRDAEGPAAVRDRPRRPA